MNSAISQKIHDTFRKFHSPDFLHMDPLCLVRIHKTPHQKEVAGLIASALAYGRVEQIIRSVETIMTRVDNDPFGFAKDTAFAEKKKRLSGFVHRFNTGTDIALLLEATGRTLHRYGSLEEAFGTPSIQGGTMREYADRFCDRLLRSVGNVVAERSRSFGYLLAKPSAGSACKRLNMYFRWMVRDDDGIDCGVWNSIPTSMLIMPLDAHTGAAARHLGLTRRTTCNWKTAEEVTESLRTIDPVDPVRFDFSLCRMGMITYRS